MIASTVSLQKNVFKFTINEQLSYKSSKNIDIAQFSDTSDSLNTSIYLTFIVKKTKDLEK